MNDTAQTLFNQIGPRTFAMLGASQIVATEQGLQFSIKGSKYGNKLVIKLTPDDLYLVEVWRIRGTECVKTGEQGFVYADSLHRTIEALTGLYTRL